MPEMQDEPSANQNQSTASTSAPPAAQADVELTSTTESHFNVSTNLSTPDSLIAGASQPVSPNFALNNVVGPSRNSDRQSPNFIKSKRFPWIKVLIGVVLGASLGLVGQFIWDLKYWVNSDVNKPIQLLLTRPSVMVLNYRLHFPLLVTERQENKYWWLLEQEFSLFWLKERLEVAGRAALAGAFIGGSLMLLLDKKTKKK
jgi:hypothetical protein